MFSWYKRWRHRRGFGIHSPSAYRLIREVLCPSSRYGFYAYRQINAMARDGYTPAELKLVYRLTVDAQPSTVAVVGDDVIANVVAMAVPSAKIVRNAENAVDFMIIGRNYEKKCPLSDTFPRWHRVLAFGDDPAKDIPSTMQSGHIFRGCGKCFAVGRADLPFEIFELKF